MSKVVAIASLVLLTIAFPAGSAMAALPQSNVAFSACAHAAGDDECDEDGMRSDVACGALQALVGTPMGTNQVTATFKPVFVTAELETCGATQGSWFADFF